MYPHSIKLKNYKCFQEELAGFEKICRFNILIGKNNSGKSSLIDIIESIALRKKIGSDVYSDVEFTLEEVIGITKRQLGQHNILKETFELYHTEIIKKIKRIRFILKYENVPTFIYINQDDINPEIPIKYGIEFTSKLKQNLYTPKLVFNFRRLNAERNILPEQSKIDNLNINESGEGCSSTFQQLNNMHKLNLRKKLRTEFLDILNFIVNPEIHFTEIYTQITEGNNFGEICLNDSNGNQIPLSKMGSGIKTIILTLANLILIPTIENKPIEDYYFAFEELENNLHPSLQRKLYQYIKDFGKKYKCTFFITTHSNIGIDIFYNCEESQIISVTNENGVSRCTNILQNDHVNEILANLGFKASDLLQTNGIIWVEGPSDRIYLNKWISLLNEDLIEGVHYSIMFYGGRLLSNISFKVEEALEELISLLKINKNGYVIMDSDATSKNYIINTTKKRIQKEIGSAKCWITDGREIENYITKQSLEKWLNSKGKPISKKIILKKFSKLEDILATLLSPVYNKNKNNYAREIIEFIDIEDIDRLDLKPKIEEIIDSIKSWN